MDIDFERLRIDLINYFEMNIDTIKENGKDYPTAVYL